MDDYIGEITRKIVTEAQETMDEFIFTTIEPFCSAVTERRITKQDLREALAVWQMWKEGRLIDREKQEAGATNERGQRQKNEEL